MPYSLASAVFRDQCRWTQTAIVVDVDGVDNTSIMRLNLRTIRAYAALSILMAVAVATATLRRASDAWLVRKLRRCARTDALTRMNVLRALDPVAGCARMMPRSLVRVVRVVCFPVSGMRGNTTLFQLRAAMNVCGVDAMTRPGDITMRSRF